jgi:hypothetical protein
VQERLLADDQPGGSLVGVEAIGGGAQRGAEVAGH